MNIKISLSRLIFIRPLPFKIFEENAQPRRISAKKGYTYLVDSFNNKIFYLLKNVKFPIKILREIRFICFYFSPHHATPDKQFIIKAIKIVCGVTSLKSFMATQRCNL